MTTSTVTISMRDTNAFDCSYAIVEKREAAVLILLLDAECAIFDYHAPESHYLLLKHYSDNRAALQDFYKLIGKMSAKASSSKYFGSRKDEDNRMIVASNGYEGMLSPADAPLYTERLSTFLAFADRMRHII